MKNKKKVSGDVVASSCLLSKLRIAMYKISDSILGG